MLFLAFFLIIAATKQKDTLKSNTFVIVFAICFQTNLQLFLEILANVCAFFRRQLKKGGNWGSFSFARGDPSLLHFSEVVPAALEWEGRGREKEEPAGEEKNANLPKE